MARNRKDCWSKDVSDALGMWYFLNDSQSESVATNLHGAFGLWELWNFNQLTGT
jgi:hypothetical protein